MFTTYKDYDSLKGNLNLFVFNKIPNIFSLIIKMHPYITYFVNCKYFYYFTLKTRQLYT